MATQFSIAEDTLNSSKSDYLNITHKLNDYNEINNLNQHLLDSNTIELNHLTLLNNQIITKLMKMKQDYMLTDYAIQESSMYSNILAFTIIVVCLTIFFVARTSNEDKAAINILIWICVAIGIIYLIILIIILRSNIKRRKYAWSQWYWNPVEQKN